MPGRVIGKVMTAMQRKHWKDLDDKFPGQIPKRRFIEPKRKSTGKARRRQNRKTKRSFSSPVIDNGSGITRSNAMLKYSKMKKVSIRDTNQDIYRDRAVGTIICKTGRTELGAVGTYLDTTMCLITAGQAEETNSDFKNVFTRTAGDQGRRFYIENVHVDTVFTNMGAATVCREIFDFVAKVDHAESVETCFTRGLADNAGINATNELITNVGSNVFDSKLVKRHWKSIGYKKVFLGTGRHHNHIFTHKYNGLIPTEKIIDQGERFGGNVVLKGITTATWIKITGLPGDSVKTVGPQGEPGVGIVSTLNAKVCYVSHYTVKSRFIAVKGRHVAYPNQLLQPTSMYGQNQDGQGGFDQGVANTLNNEAMI